MIITDDFAAGFARNWAAAWNSHDMDRILEHYSEGFTITSPIALQRLPDSGGRITGKAAVSAYWTLALEKIPDLYFEVLDVLAGVNGITVYYRNTATNKRSVEVMLFDNDGKVAEAIVHYAG